MLKMARFSPHHRGPFDTSNANPPSATASSSSSAPPFTNMFPGFLSDSSDYSYDPTLASLSPSSSSRSPLPSQTHGSGFSAQVKQPKSAAPSRSFPRSSNYTPAHHSEASASASPSQSAATTPSSGKAKRRPKPLDLKAGPGIGQDEELASQREEAGIPSALSTGFTIVSASSDDESDISANMQNLSVLRHHLRQNLKDRPIDGSGSSLDRFTDSDHDSARSPYDRPHASATITIESLVPRLAGPDRPLIIDTRPLGSFLESHLPGSAHISIPSLIYKRFRKTGGKGATWDSLASFVSTPAGRRAWGEAPRGDLIVIVGLSADDEVATTICAVMLEFAKEVRILTGGWPAVLRSPEAVSTLLSGENDDRSDHIAQAQASLPPPKTAPLNVPTFSLEPPPIPNHPTSTSTSTLSHQASMPSLRSGSGSGIKRNVPALSIQPVSRHPPKLSINLDKAQSPRSATTGSFPDLNRLTADQAPRSPGVGPSTPNRGSFQTMCHEQAKAPSSPFNVASGSTQQRYPNSPKTSRLAVAPFVVSTILPSFLFLGPEITSVEEIASLKSMGIKRILNVALECEDDQGIMKGHFDRYLKVPMRDIVEETGVAKFMRDANDFLDDARLHSAPTYVHCKAGKSRSVTVVLAYLIHANAWPLKTAYAYVAERRKGISPNIGFVAELMQFEESELGLKQSSGVHGETAQGKAESRATAGNGKAGGVPINQGQGQGQGKPKPKPRHTRESLPPAWSSSSSLDSRPARAAPVGDGSDDLAPGEDQDGSHGRRRQMQEEMEVRKNGQWVHHRRVPFDRTTLQPGRRVSKAGLESLRPLAMETASFTKVQAERSDRPGAPEPIASPGAGEKEVVTPSPDGPLNWI